MAAVLGIALILAFVVGVGALLSRATQRRREATARAAEILGLVLLSGDRDDAPEESWNVHERYAGEVQGHAVDIAHCERLAIVGGAAAPIAAVRVRVRVGSVHADGLALTRRVFGVPTQVETGDPTFDRNVAVQTENLQAVRERLADPALRESLRTFLTAGAGSASVRDGTVETLVFDAHMRGAPAIQAAVRSALDVARRLAR